MILSAEAFASQDHENLKPMLDGAKKNVDSIGKTPDYFEGKELTADSNYHSLESLTVCKEEKVAAYIPDIQFRKRDPGLPSRSVSKIGRRQVQSRVFQRR